MPTTSEVRHHLSPNYTLYNICHQDIYHSHPSASDGTRFRLSATDIFLLTEPVTITSKATGTDTRPFQTMAKINW